MLRWYKRGLHNRPLKAPKFIRPIETCNAGFYVGKYAWWEAPGYPDGTRRYALEPIMMKLMS